MLNLVHPSSPNREEDARQQQLVLQTHEADGVTDEEHLNLSQDAAVAESHLYMGVPIDSDLQGDAEVYFGNDPEHGDLASAESKIDLNVLSHTNADDAVQKQKRFRRTVFAVQAIVNAKLYRTKSQSLEAYFKDVWKYLEGFEIVPCRERLCRSLKRLARNKMDTRRLWAKVLDAVEGKHEEVSSTTITDVWNDLYQRRMVSGLTEAVLQSDPNKRGRRAILKEDDINIMRWLKPRTGLPGDDSENSGEEAFPLMPLEQLENCLEGMPVQQAQAQGAMLALTMPMESVEVDNTSVQPLTLAQSHRIATQPQPPPPPPEEYLPNETETAMACLPTPTSPGTGPKAPFTAQDISAQMTASSTISHLAQMGYMLQPLIGGRRTFSKNTVTHDVFEHRSLGGRVVGYEY
ncbi:hypothetical protein HDU96_007555 [Phlyctochytrium bullatum]|nr:hypothetical protein HDU96_007555 [Phlyctochytrium bullatum]